MVPLIPCFPPLVDLAPEALALVLAWTELQTSMVCSKWHGEVEGVAFVVIRHHFAITMLIRSSGIKGLRL
jgi:hypothetical protein